MIVLIDNLYELIDDFTNNLIKILDIDIEYIDDDNLDEIKKSFTSYNWL